MRERIANGATIGYVSDGGADDRRYDEGYADHARAQLRRFVDDNETQTDAGKLLGVNQSTVGRSLDPAKQPSLRIIIALAECTNRTVDDILGIQRPGLGPAEEMAQMRRSIASLLDEMAKLRAQNALLLSQTPPAPPAEQTRVRETGKKR